MKMTRPCVSSGNFGWHARGALYTYMPSSHSQPMSVPWAGSLWDPNITVETLEAYRLRVSFTLWDESTHYQILLNSFPRTENQRCFKHILDIPAVTLATLNPSNIAQSHLSKPSESPYWS